MTENLRDYKNKNNKLVDISNEYDNKIMVERSTIFKIKYK